MTRLASISCKIPPEWQKEIQDLAQYTRKSESEILREALGQYLKKTNPVATGDALAQLAFGVALLEDRVANLENKLAGLGRLVG